MKPIITVLCLLVSTACFAHHHNNNNNYGNDNNGFFQGIHFNILGQHHSHRRYGFPYWNRFGEYCTPTDNSGNHYHCH